jgi:hypothetical protein
MQNHRQYTARRESTFYRPIKRWPWLKHLFADGGALYVTMNNA